MHYFAAAVIPAGVDRQEAEVHVEKLMAPYCEDWNDDHKNGFWDWFVVGGRWTGVWAEYDPTKDPRNLETCFICNGTGERPGGREQFGDAWYEWSHGCNGCLGEGMSPKHPSQWAVLDDDMIPVERFLRLPEVFRRPITIVTPDGAIEREPWNGDDFEKHTDEEWETKLQSALAPFCQDQLVVVDYHS